MEEQKPYIIVSTDNLENLALSVNAMMEEGYIPIGGPFHGDLPLNQAMVLNGTQKVITLP